MRFGVFNSLTNTTWETVQALWRHADATGWDVACVTDHFMPAAGDPALPTLEAWTVVSALAVQVPRMRVGTIVLGNTYRYPAVVAKMAATLDIVAGGRLLFGLGAAWQENEHRAYGLHFGTMGERLARLEEACQVVKSLWTQDRTTFKGRFYQLEDAPGRPRPRQQPHPELMIGGGGEKVTLRIVARHADHWNVWGGPDILTRKGRILDEHCAAAGRDGKTLVRSANMPVLFADDRAQEDKLVRAVMSRLGRSEPEARDTVLAGSVEAIRDKLGRLREAGVDLLFVPTMFLPADARPVLDRVQGELAPAFR